MSENVEKMSENCPEGLKTQFLDNVCLFGRCSCLVTLSNARPLQGWVHREALCIHLVNDHFDFEVRGVHTLKAFGLKWSTEAISLEGLSLTDQMFYHAATYDCMFNS